MVRRITVDSILSGGLVRLEICDLVEGRKRFRDEARSWCNYRDIIVTKKTFKKEMRIPPGQEDGIPWNSLQEGQVYLSGQLARPRLEKPEIYIARPGKPLVIRIDRWIRKDLESLYFKALERTD